MGAKMIKHVVNTEENQFWLTIISNNLKSVKKV